MFTSRFVFAWFGLACGVAGCQPSPSTFGLAVEYVDAAGLKGTMCSPAGSAQGGAGVRLDRKGSAEGTFPHLWAEIHQNGDDEPFTMEVFAVPGYEGRNLVPTSKSILKATSYDEAFGQGGRADTFRVAFEGGTYSFRVTGLAPNAACPAPAP